MTPAMRQYWVGKPHIFRTPGNKDAYVAMFKADEVKRLLNHQHPAWTTEKPTKPGWYWWRHSTMARVQMARVDEMLAVSCMNELCSICEADHVDECDGQWAGPLEPPHE